MIQDHTAYLKQGNEIRVLYVEKQAYMEKLDEQISERDGKRKTFDGVIHTLCGINGGRSSLMRFYGAGCSIILWLRRMGSWMLFSRVRLRSL